MISLAYEPLPRPHECLECFLVRAEQPGGCDGTLAMTELWLSWQDCDADHVVDYLESRGGFCDCEVRLNVLLPGDQAFVEDVVLSCGEAEL
ncbi:MAG: DUF2695 domain-containing protein [Mycobacteriales bacterium]